MICESFFGGLLTTTNPARINTEPTIPMVETVSLKSTTPKIDAVSGSIKPTVTAVAAPILAIP
jgi:hypothetical protein